MMETLKTILEVGFTISFFLMAWLFAVLVAGRKKGDQQIINDQIRRINKLAARNGELAKEIAELRAYRDSINGILKDRNCRGNKRRKITIEKTNGKKELQTILEEVNPIYDEQLDN